MNTAFFNTTHEVQPELSQFRQPALNQDVKVLSFFRQHAGETFTPSEIWVRTGMESQAVPLTSARRSITNLTKDGYLVRTINQRLGPYGRNESTWVYPRERAA